MATLYEGTNTIPARCLECGSREGKKREEREKENTQNRSMHEDNVKDSRGKEKEARTVKGKKYDDENSLVAAKKKREEKEKRKTPLN